MLSAGFDIDDRHAADSKSFSQLGLAELGLHPLAGCTNFTPDCLVQCAGICHRGDLTPHGCLMSSTANAVFIRNGVYVSYGLTPLELLKYFCGRLRHGELPPQK